MDAGDAVQGNVMGTLTQGQALVDIMNATGYDYVIPGNHEFDYGMPQFNHLVGGANATYLSCNFTDKRPEVPTLMFAPYAIQDYPLADGSTARVAFVGVTTPATLTASSPKSFWRSDDDHTCVYGFCEDDTGAALAAAVQNAVDQARAAGADYVVLLAHLGQDGSPDIWRSDALAKRCRGIDVIIDGHSHQEYVQVMQDTEGKNVIITQTGTQFSSVGQVVINPNSGTISASTPAFEATLLREARKSGDPAYVQEATFGRDANVQDAINKKVADVEAQTGTVIGKSEVDLYAFEDDNYTWAVRAHETNLGDFVTDAYLYYATNAGVMADIAFVNGGGVRANLNRGNVTKGDLINVNPFKRRVRRAKLHGKAIDPQAAYTLVCHSYYLVEGGGSYSMLCKNPVTLLGLDNDALMEYVQLNLRGVIGQQYAKATGQGRIATQVGPDPDPDTDPDPTPKPEPEQPEPQPPANDASDPKPLAPTGDDGALKEGTAAVAAAAAVGAAAFATAHAETEDERA